MHPFFCFKTILLLNYYYKNIKMIILKKQNQAQTIKFIPRDYSANILVLRNETTNNSVTLTPEFFIDGYYLKCDVVLDLTENTFYNLSIFNSESELFNQFKERVLLDNGILESEECLEDLLEKTIVLRYRDKIFCTNQSVDTFTVNNNQYVENITTNEFKVYE